MTLHFGTRLIARTLRGNRLAQRAPRVELEPEPHDVIAELEISRQCVAGDL